MYRLLVSVCQSLVIGILDRPTRYLRWLRRVPDGLATGCEVLVAGYWSLITCHRIWVVSYWLSVTRYRLLLIGDRYCLGGTVYYSLVIGFGLVVSVTGYSCVVIGLELLVTVQRLRLSGGLSRQPRT